MNRSDRNKTRLTATNNFSIFYFNLRVFISLTVLSSTSKSGL